MKKLLTFVCWLMGYAVVAQQQVTDFEGLKIKNLRYVQKVDTINGKLIFSIYNAEISNYSTWVTDGSPENTHLLTDSTGKGPDLIQGSLRAYDYLYLRREYIYRTKGETLERVIPNTSSLEGFHVFNNKILLYYRNYQSNGTENRNVSEFDWLNEDNTRTKWDENVILYKIIDSTLHYLKFNYQTRLYELCRLTKNGVLTKNIIANPNVGIINNFQYLSHHGMDYYFFDVGNGRKMLAKPENSNDDVQLADWGVNSYFPLAVQDSAQHIYFLKYDGTLTFYALSADNELTPWKNVLVSSISLSNNDIYGYGVVYRNFIMTGDKLVFTSTKGSEGINSYFLNVFDLKSGVNIRSKNLVEYFRWYYWDMGISVIDSNTYVLDNLANMKITYSFLKDTVLSVNPYPLKIDSLVTLPQHTLLLSDGIYNFDKGVKTPLLPIRPIYDINQSAGFQFRLFNNRIIYWKYNPVSQYNEVWASKGEKNDLELLVSFKGGFNYWGDNLFVQETKIYFHAANELGGISYYETDGTKAGTRKIFETKAILGNITQNVRKNAAQLIVRLADGANTGNIVIIKDGKGKLVSFPIKNYFETYLTQNDAYITKTDVYTNDLYKVTGDTLTLIDRNIYNTTAYHDSLFYTRGVSMQDNPLDLYTIVDGSATPVRFLTNPINDYGIYGNKLLYTQYLNGSHVFTVVDLPTNKTEISRARSAANGIRQYLNGALVLFRDTKLLLIRNGSMKEYDMGFHPTNGIFAFNKGILLVGVKDITYYDLSNDNISKVLINEYFNASWLLNLLLKDNDFFMIPLGAENEQPTWAYWSVVEKRLWKFNPNIASFANVHKNGAFSSTKNGEHKTYWYFNGSQLIESYQLPDYDPNKVFKTNEHLYAPIATAETGPELYQFDTKSLMAYPEIVHGAEGADIRLAFDYNNQVYVYGFTLDNGWQIWKMSDPKAVFIEPDGPLATEPIVETLVVYPNPTQDRVSVNTEKTLPYRIINTRGQVLMQGKAVPKQEIDIRQLPQGIYLIQLFDERRVYVRKVVKE
ncbi:T9SS type A sorting domain-containing protein [Emticicia agri]|uniref:T9SS type A sorting domain-containing protein n=1 Tax=Emticicia agri TaxID=2492393 RepID=A0A4Q5LWA1_9BACT|nr:T9SS type A sorting domain-containing protein [Emticicia agri]RYU93827.1 T9SS type A sorting domain-containing protein [Emticicia agri]